jgi:peptide/nickel transport system permease protein
MIAYIVRRTLLAAFTILVISFLTFIIVQLPEGDMVDAYLNLLHERGMGEAPGRSIEQIVVLKEAWGLNRPLLVQWWDWFSGIIFQGDFGYAFSVAGHRAGGGPVVDLITARIPFTIYLSIFTIVITWTFAIPIGIYSAMRQNSIGDYVFTLLGFTGLAVPDFLLGLVLMYIAFAYFDHAVGGIFSGEYLNSPWSVGRLIDMLSHMLIPAIVIGTAGTAGLIRIMRNNLLDELSKPYVVTARAKGLPSWKVVVKYPVRVAINPFISGIGGLLPALLSADAIVSVVLSLPTLGPILLDGLMKQDAALTGAIILMYSSLTVVGVLISDLLLVVVDPRIKLTGSARRGGEGF